MCGHWARLGEKHFCLFTSNQCRFCRWTVCRGHGKWLIAFSHMHNATTLELNRRRPKTSCMVTHNKQSSKLDQERIGSNPDRKSFCGWLVILSQAYNFLKSFLGCLSVERSWVLSLAVVCLSVWCYTTLQPRPPCPWLESQVWTLGPNSYTWFLSPIFHTFSSCFRAFFQTVVQNWHNHFCLWWSGFLGLVERWRGWRTGWSGWRRRREGTQNWTKYFRWLEAALKISFCVKLTLIWLSEKRRSRRKLRWNNHEGWVGGDLWNVWGEEIIQTELNYEVEKSSTKFNHLSFEMLDNFWMWWYTQ